MRLFARIDNGIVQELYSPPALLASFDLAELFAPGMGWRDVSTVSPTPAVGWHVAGESFTAPPPAPPAPPAPPPSLPGLADQLAALRAQMTQLGEQLATLSGQSAGGGKTGSG